jgi:anti-anti-sigma regulatory factor
MKADVVVFALSGEMDIEHTERLQKLLDIDKHNRILLDLKDVTLVGRAAVQFLARVEGGGVRIVNCPDYVRSWMAAENSGTQSA